MFLVYCIYIIIAWWVA